VAPTREIIDRSEYAPAEFRAERTAESSPEPSALEQAPLQAEIEVPQRHAQTPSAADYAQPEVVEEHPQSVAPMSEPALPALEQPPQQPTPTLEQPPAPPLKLELPSDLVQIETDPSKARTVAVEEEAPAPRSPRARPAPLPVTSEPLVQVETRQQRESAPSAP
jgi:hypothetical protein